MTTPAAGPASSGSVVKSGFRHQGCLYGSDAEFLEVAVPFVQDGLRRGEPVLVTTTAANRELLHTAMGADADRIAFAESAYFGRRPAQLANALRRYWHRHRSHRADRRGAHPRRAGPRRRARRRGRLAACGGGLQHVPGGHRDLDDLPVRHQDRRRRRGRGGPAHPSRVREERPDPRRPRRSRHPRRHRGARCPRLRAPPATCSASRGTWSPSGATCWTRRARCCGPRTP